MKVHTFESEIAIRIGIKMESRLRALVAKICLESRTRGHFSLDSPRFGGMGSLKTTIRGQLMVVEVADICV